MPLSLDQYRVKLITKILITSSQDNVKRYIIVAMKALEQNDVNEYIVARFVDKMVSELAQYHPVNKNLQQLINIEMAMLELNRIKRQINAKVD